MHSASFRPTTAPTYPPVARYGRFFRAAVLAMLAATPALLARSLRAQDQAPMPPAIYSVGAAYDDARHRLVVFGGYGRGGYSGDTWEWDGRSWRRVATEGPGARNAPALAYDAARRQIVLFGGDTRATGALGDTWVYDSAGWRRVATAGPRGRTTTQLAYDSQRQRVVLFGGASGDTILGDTWEWDGARWHEVAREGPPARALHGLAYDAARGVTVLFGGTGVLAPDAPSFGDTWEWNGARWTRRDVTGPSARDHIAMSYDPVHRVTVMHGGGLGPRDPGETWTFDGRAWTLAVASGPRRRYARLAFDTEARAMLLYAGFDDRPSNELYRLDGGTWRLQRPDDRPQ